MFIWDIENEKRVTMNKLTKKVFSATFNNEGTFFITVGVNHLKFWYFDENGDIIKQKVI